MRTLTDHIVEGDTANQLAITVMDEPGAGGACHQYQIEWPGFIRDLQGTGSPAPQYCNIGFQNGPIKERGVNGLTQEALLAIIIDRLRSFQAGPFDSPMNASALTHCEAALHDLQERTRERIKRGVEGRTVA